MASILTGDMMILKHLTDRVRLLEYLKFAMMPKLHRLVSEEGHAVEHVQTI